MTADTCDYKRVQGFYHKLVKMIIHKNNNERIHAFCSICENMMLLELITQDRYVPSLININLNMCTDNNSSNVTGRAQTQAATIRKV